MARVATGNFKKGINNRPAKVQLLTPGTKARGFSPLCRALKKSIKGSSVNVNKNP